MNAGSDIMACLVVWHSFDGELQLLGGYCAHRPYCDPDGWKMAVCARLIAWEQGDRALFDRAKARWNGGADIKPSASANQA